MKFRVLGCSGGIGLNARTTSFLVDDDVLIDAGTGVEDLSIEELALIDHVFLTHSHLDHIAALPLLVDSVGNRRSKPLTVYALADTILALKTHIFNWVIWPDFTEIPHYDAPWMKFCPIQVGTVTELAGKTENRAIKSLAANHTVPALAYHLRSPKGSIIYSGDNVPTDDFWSQVNGVSDLKALIIETAFSNREQDLATTSKHLYPILLGTELEKLRVEPQVYVTHLKPADRQLIENEIQAWAGRFNPKMLQRGDVIDIA